jgi:hypothetical protein
MKIGWYLFIEEIGGELNLLNADSTGNRRFAMINIDNIKIQNFPECSKKITVDFVELNNAGLKPDADML